MIKLPVTAADVEAAAHRIANDVVHTHSQVSQTLSALLGARVIIKFENLQFTASFKDRGSANKMHLLSADQRAAGIIALSAGNHAQGVAYHAGKMGIPATIVMPETAPFAKVRNTEALGATVVQAGATFADAAQTAHDLAEEQGLTWVHPFDDPAVIAGQGTVALELLADHDDLDAIVVPTGGGGLLSGIATYAKHHRPEIEVVGVQSEAFPGVAAALTNEPLEPVGTETLADGIAVKSPGENTLAIIDALVDDVVTVSEQSIEQAVAMFIEIEKTVAEGAGAAGLAALIEDPERFAGRTVAVVLSGGNIDTRVLASVLMRELVDSQRIVTLRISVGDVPGQLAPVITTIADLGANIVEIDHRRIFDPISARRANVDVVVETRGPDHTVQVVAALTEAGFTPEVLRS